MRINFKTGGVALVAALAIGVVVGPSAASAKTYKASWTLTGDKGQKCQLGCNATGKVKGAPFGGPFKATSFVAPPLTKDTYKLKGGTLKVNWTSTLEGTTATGTWKVIKGTGKYKGAKGKGTVSGDIVKGVFKYKGKLTY